MSTPRHALLPGRPGCQNGDLPGPFLAGEQITETLSSWGRWPARHGDKDDTQWSQYNLLPAWEGRLAVQHSWRGQGRREAKHDAWRIRDDKTTNYPLRGHPGAGPGLIGLHQSIRPGAADYRGRPRRRRQRGCNRGCRRRRTRSGARRCNRRSSGCSGGPYHDATTARSLRILQSPALRLLQSPTIRELPPAKTSLRRLRTSRGEHRDGHPINERSECRAAGVIPCRKRAHNLGGRTVPGSRELGPRPRKRKVNKKSGAGLGQENPGTAPKQAWSARRNAKPMVDPTRQQSANRQPGGTLDLAFPKFKA